MKIGVIRGQKQSDKRKSAGVSTLLCANWLKNCVCKVIFLLSSYSVNPLPTIEQLSAEFNGSTVFTKPYMRKIYLQVPFAEDSRYLTAFVTHEGVFSVFQLPKASTELYVCLMM